MPRFSFSSREKLETCDTRLQALFEVVILYYDCKVLEGYRSKERQLELYYNEATRVKVGKHNSEPSLAVDVAPYPIKWDDHKRFYLFAGFVLGVASVMGIPLRWGGDWDGDRDIHDQEFNDLVHFEITSS